MKFTADVDMEKGQCYRCPFFEQVNDLLFYKFGGCKLDEDLTIIDMEVDEEECSLEES